MRARRGREWDWVRRRWRKDGEERAEYRDLQTHFAAAIWWSGRWLKIRWRVSWGRLLNGEESIGIK